VHQNQSVVAEIWQFAFLKMAAIHFFDLWSTLGDDPESVLGISCLYHFAKFGWNRCNCYDSTKV